MRYVASLVTLYLIQLNVNGYILKGNEYVNERERDASVLDDYPIRQSAGVQGRFLCDGKPIKKAIRLVAEVGLDNATYVMYYWNDGLDENEATDDGVFFRVSGWAPHHQGRGGALGSIDPRLKVFHRCKQEDDIDYDPRTKRNCVRRNEYVVPYTFVFDGMVPEKLYDIGTIDLAQHVKAYICGGCEGSNKHREEPQWRCDEKFP
ncbi:Protein TTR-39 a [Aphelenchoides avenae]|nr:Protein TTR-39 a [Aphelenchus avenae]